MKVLLVSAELSPLVRTGGLGDAVAGLAAALAEAGQEVTVALPRYRHLEQAGEPVEPAPPAAAVRRLRQGAVEVLVVDDPPAFDRHGIYGPSPGRTFVDEWWRWGRFALAVERLASRHDLVHLHDGHAGPLLLRSPVPSVLTIHNAAFPVLGPLGQSAALLGLGPEFTRPTGPLEWYGQANYLKAGIVGAGRVTTVSPSFARQLTEDEAVSGGLAPVLRSLPRPLLGIPNGIDASAWDPSSDPALPAIFSADDLAGRATCRKVLLEQAGVEEGMAFGMVGRMADQKGIRLLDGVLDDLVQEGFRMVAVGEGELEGLVDRWSARHPGAVRRLPYTEELARLVFAGSDAYLMPSRFEPCGLGQLYAMRYGAPPVVRLTGGLADTVVDVDEDPARGTGFGFRPYLPEELLKTIRRARRLHAHFPDEWRELQRRGMRTDWSWDRAAAAYLEIYREVAAG